MKRDEFVMALFAALIEDIKQAFPTTSHPSLERDVQRFNLNVEFRGSEFYAIDLPILGDSLSLALSHGSIESIHGKPMSTPRKGDSSLPKFLNELWIRIFSTDGLLLEHPDPFSILSLRTLLYVFKRIEGELTDERIAEAKRSFFEQERAIRRSTLAWNGPDLGDDRTIHLNDGIPDRGSTVDLFTDQPCFRDALGDVTQKVCDVFFSSIESPDWTLGRSRHGPGAVSDARSGADKYQFPSWPRRLQGVFPIDAFVCWSHPDDLDFPDKENPAKLIAVPKDSRGPRLIASEPTSHQYTQQVINDWLRNIVVGRTALTRSIDFTSQTPSQLLAIEASRTQEYATVDLKSASDLLSCWLVERLIRKNPLLLQALHATRTPWIVDGQNACLLNKYAPMGNATVFPLQTILYTLLSISVLIFRSGVKPTMKSIKKYASKVRVFGDDIIIPTECYEDLVELLSYCGLQVNTKKSFSTGKFREACGIDAFDGEVVTPPYVKRQPGGINPDDVLSTIELSNNFHMKGFWNAAKLITSLLPERVSKLIPTVSSTSGIQGLKSFCGSLTPSVTRYNPFLQREEQKVLTFSTSVEKCKVPGLRNLTQYCIERPSADTRWTAGIQKSARTKMRPSWVPC